MQALEWYNPVVIMVYYLTLSCLIMFSQNPVLLLLGLLGALGCFCLGAGGGAGRVHLFSLAVFAVMALGNPLFSHHGMTVLFVLNDSPITLEATIYGVCSGGTVVTVLYLFRSFHRIMTRDRLLYVFGKLSPKLALLLSMTLRYVPLFTARAKQTAACQKALGLYKEDNILDKIKADMRVFSILLTWALENGITTADSMAARGYGTCKRTFYTRFSYRRADALLLVLILACFGITVGAMACGILDMTFYPSLSMAPVTPLAVVAYAAFGFLAAMPAGLEMGERIKWRYLQSKI